MTAFVIHAAGRGSRMGRAGDFLHKALLPLGGRALISHQIALAPPEARLIVCTGYRAGQIRGYFELAHPGRLVTYVPVSGWDSPGAGPGASLLAARGEVGADNLIFAPCDALWEPDRTLWGSLVSWAGVAPQPAGTRPERWCRIDSAGTGLVVRDKTSAPGGAVFTGLAAILRRDLPVFWRGLETAPPVAGERQISGGLAALARSGRLAVRQTAWTDIGDEAAYAREVAAVSGYDWTKPGEATYVLPEQGRVIKIRADKRSLARKAARQASIGAATPKITGTRPGMFAYEYVPGVTGYEAADDPDLIRRLLAWATANLWKPVRAHGAAAACLRFYRDKTGQRIAMLSPELRMTARRAAAAVSWHDLAGRCEPVTFHGDFNLGNVIATPDGGFAGIDWREDFAGESWGDRRYDLGKLAAGLIVHWGNARRGDFAEWPAGQTTHLRALADWHGGTIPRDVLIIAGLTMLNSAPLHQPPLDEILVGRGSRLLGEVL